MNNYKIAKEYFNKLANSKLKSKRLYHGSSEDFAELVPDPSKRRVMNSLGMWLTSSPEVAEWYGPKIYEADLPSGEYLQAKDLEYIFFDKQLAKQFGISGPWNDDTRNQILFNWDYLNAWKDKMKSKGYAGIVWKNSYIDRESKESPHDVYLIFSEGVPVRRVN